MSFSFTTARTLQFSIDYLGLIEDEMGGEEPEVLNGDLLDLILRLLKMLIEWLEEMLNETSVPLPAHSTFAGWYEDAKDALNAARQGQPVEDNITVALHCLRNMKQMVEDEINA